MAGQSPQPFDPNVYFADADISADGRYVAFVSFWTDLVPNPGGANASGDVYLWDRVTGTTTLISHAAGDPVTTADGFALYVRISADGNYVVFTSWGAIWSPASPPPPRGGNSTRSSITAPRAPSL